MIWGFNAWGSQIRSNSDSRAVLGLMGVGRSSNATGKRRFWVQGAPPRASDGFKGLCPGPSLAYRY